MVDDHKEEEKLIFNGIYQANKKINSGSFGTVYSGTNLQSNEQIAIKLEKNNVVFLGFNC